MAKGKKKQTAGAAVAVPVEPTYDLVSLFACLRIVFPLSQPAPQQPLSAEPLLHPLFVLVSFQVECVSLLEAVVQLLPSCPSSELFNEIVKQVCLLPVCVTASQQVYEPELPNRCVTVLPGQLPL